MQELVVASNTRRTPAGGSRRDLGEILTCLKLCYEHSDDWTYADSIILLFR